MDLLAKVRSGVVWCTEEEYAGVLTAMIRDGWRVYTLDGSKVYDARSFFEQVKVKLPLDPPLGIGYVWDALADSLWGGLDALETSRIAIGWDYAAQTRRVNSKDFEMAVQVLGDVAQQLADENITVGRPKIVAIVVPGTVPPSVMGSSAS